MKNTATISRKAKRTRRAAMQKAATKETDKYVRHKEEKSGNLIMKIMLGIVAIFIAIVFVFLSGAFDIEEIIVEGNNSISEQQLISFSGVQMATNLFAVSKKEIISKLKENPYIQEVEVKRILPDKLKISVSERNLTFAVPFANSYLYIDKQGVVLEVSNTNPDVPIVSGFSTDLSSLQSGDQLNSSDLEKLNMVKKIMEKASANELANLITKIDVSDENNYTIYFDTEEKVAYLGEGSDLNTRFLYIKSILKEQTGKKGEIFVNVDLNQEYVYFRENP